PQQWPLRASLSLAYMVVFATLIAFSLYGYLLQRLKPVSVALIQLITPVTSLLLGHYLNQEPISMAVWLGTGLIMLGLLVYQSPALPQKK
ncbi:MAG: EamA family transporter, partial [Burkholderiales bacterium]